MQCCMQRYYASKLWWNIGRYLPAGITSQRPSHVARPSGARRQHYNPLQWPAARHYNLLQWPATGHHNLLQQLATENYNPLQRPAGSALHSITPACSSALHSITTACIFALHSITTVYRPALQPITTTCLLPITMPLQQSPRAPIVYNGCLSAFITVPCIT